MKKGSGTCDSLADGRPLSILHLQGRYMPGETAEQWRGEGYCQRMVLTEDLLNKLPSYTITSMVASKRMEKEKGSQVEELNDGISGVRARAVLFGRNVVPDWNSPNDPLFCVQLGSPQS